MSLLHRPVLGPDFIEDFPQAGCYRELYALTSVLVLRLRERRTVSCIIVVEDELFGHVLEVIGIHQAWLGSIGINVFAEV